MADFRPTKPALIWELPFEAAWPTSVAFLGSARRLAAGNRDGQLLLWDLPETPSKTVPSPVRRLDGHTNGITHLLSTSDGKTLISSSLDHTVRLWDPQAPPTGSAEVIVDIHTREREAKRTRKNDILTSPGIKVQTQQASQVLTGHGDWVNALGMSGDQKRLISGDDGSVVLVWDLATKKEISRWKVEHWVIAAALSPDGQTALVSEYRSKGGDFNHYPPALKLWNVADGKLKLDLTPDSKNRREYGKFFAGGLVAAAFSPDGKLLAVGQGGETDTGKVHLMDAATGKLLRSVSGHQYGVTDVLFSADSQHVLSCGRDTVVRICKVADGKEVAQLGKPRGGQFKDWLHAVALSPDQQWVATADIAGKIQVWRLTS